MNVKETILGVVPLNAEGMVDGPIIAKEYLNVIFLQL
jgi:hypothetical protein